MKISHGKSALFISLVLSVISICDAAATPAPGVDPNGFADRNSAANLKKEGKELLSRTFIGGWDAKEFKRSGRWTQMGAVRAQMDQGDYAAALELFKRYTLQKLREVDSYGLPKSRFDPYSSGVPGAQWIRPQIQPDQYATVLKNAEDLMEGFITSNIHNYNSVGIMTGEIKRIQIGEPGTIDWRTFSANTPKGNVGWPWDVSAFDPLLAAYIITGEQKYLDRWSAYADDWAINQHDGLCATQMADLPDHWSEGAQDALNFLNYLGGIAAQPKGPESFPAATFARVMTRFIDDYIPTTIIYHRACPENWTDASLTSLTDLGFFMDEYPVGEQMIHEAKRRLELLTPTHNLPDGPDLDSTVGYGGLYLLGAGTVLDRVQTRQIRIPEWMLTGWEEKDLHAHFDLGSWMEGIREDMRNRARFLVAHTMANGEWPIGGTRSDRHNRAVETYDKTQYFVPEIFKDEDMARILDIGTGRALTPVPSFTSERFPYGGFNYIRAGWDPQDPYLFMYCSPWAIGGSLSARNNNAIGLSAYGCDLLETGENGTYDQPHSPVRVDGEEQNFRYGIPIWGHRGPMITATDCQIPPSWRWHDSPQFALAEGVYSGDFGSKPITGVTHQRLVQYVRRAGLWIITDRLMSTDAHHYTLDWRFGIQPGHPTDFTDSQIKLDVAENAIKTARPGGANVSLYHFPSEPLTYSNGEERTPPTRGYRIHDFFRVSADWKSSGESVVVTAIFPRKTQDVELSNPKSISGNGTSGFEATTPNGFHISYQAANSAPGIITAGDISVTGESLLVVTASDGKVSGIALGCRSFRNGGVSVSSLPTADRSRSHDFEFELANGSVNATAIYTTVQPVEITPSASDMFLGSQQLALSCATSGVDIRYTLDGSDPTPSSDLYTRPITITASTTVKTRAFRVGTTIAPETMSGTIASVVTKAAFKAGTLSSAVQIPSTKPGLHYDYYEGRWQDLLTGLDRLTPLKSGDAQGLFDLSAKGKVKTYAFKYSGYIDVPSDGVYTFRAPAEFYQPNIMAGYDLHLYVDGGEWYPGTERHALGNWSVALQKGKHSFLVTYADLRGDAVEKMNKSSEKPFVWSGNAPDIEVSGPDITEKTIPGQWFCH